MAVKRRLLEETVRDDPEPEDYEGWLLGRCDSAGGPVRKPAEFVPSGPIRAMALDVLGEWRLAQASGVFREWLERGAPSEDVIAQAPCSRAPPADCAPQT